jgi:hypothetical protein
MVQLKYAILCEQAVISQPTGQLSLINIVNGINVPGFPATVSNMLYLVIGWERALSESKVDEAFKARIAIQGPTSKTPVFAKDFIDVKFPPNDFVVNSISQLDTVFVEPGGNKIFIDQEQRNGKWKRVASMTLDVSVVPG